MHQGVLGMHPCVPSQGMSGWGLNKRMARGSLAAAWHPQQLP